MKPSYQLRGERELTDKQTDTKKWLIVAIVSIVISAAFAVDFLIGR